MTYKSWSSILNWFKDDSIIKGWPVFERNSNVLDDVSCHSSKRISLANKKDMDIHWNKVDMTTFFVDSTALLLLM